MRRDTRTERREQLKLGMAITLANYLGVRHQHMPNSGIYEALNAAGWFWFPGRLAWGEVVKPDGDELVISK